MKPVAVSCGEPAGIGPEIALKAWQALHDTVPMVWIGDPNHLPKDAPVSIVASAREASEISHQRFAVLHQTAQGPLTHGVANPTHARAVISSIETAVSLTKRGDTSAVCTAPIHKKALIDGAEFAYPGHTEFLAALDGKTDVVMMLASAQLRVVPATIHIPLAQVPTELTADKLESTLRITHAALRRNFAISHPRLAVAGLNPHAGEGGKMGTEDDALIAPVVQKLKAEGLQIKGPLPADTMFHAAARASYDAAVCMYHDQALIPIKTLDFDMGVNVTLGLDFIRTSPDHGTAFDIAGMNKANPTSMIQALKLAYEMGNKQ